MTKNGVNVTGSTKIFGKYYTKIFSSKKNRKRQITPVEPKKERQPYQADVQVYNYHGKTNVPGEERNKSVR